MNKEISLEEMCKHFRVLCLRIAKIKDWQLKKDLISLSVTSRDYSREVNKELVNCRQQKRITRKYEIMFNQYYESLEILEQHVVEAILIDS